MNKDFFQSKGTWGALFLLLAPVLESVGVQLDTEAVIESITVVIGGVLFLWGQFTRKSEITSVAGIKVK